MHLIEPSGIVDIYLSKCLCALNEVFLFSNIYKYVLKGDAFVPQFALPSYDPE